MVRKLIIVMAMIGWFCTSIAQACESGNCQNGFGEKIFADGRYRGFFKKGKLNGAGHYTYLSGKVFYEEFKNGLKQGFGLVLLKNGRVFYGHFGKDLPMGDGIMQFQDQLVAGIWNGKKFISQYSKEEHNKNPDNCKGNCYDGYGLKIEEESIVSSGLYKKGKLVLGYLFNDGDEYRGFIKNKQANGFGYIKQVDGNSYFGQVLAGKKHGLGMIIDNSGTHVIQAGQFAKGRLMDDYLLKNLDVKHES